MWSSCWIERMEGYKVHGSLGCGGILLKKLAALFHVGADVFL